MKKGFRLRVCVRACACIVVLSLVALGASSAAWGEEIQAGDVTIASSGCSRGSRKATRDLLLTLSLPKSRASWRAGRSSNV